MTRLLHEEDKAIDGYIGESSNYRVRPDISHIFHCPDFLSLSVKEKENLIHTFKTITAEKVFLHRTCRPSTGDKLEDFKVEIDNCKIYVPFDILNFLYIKASKLMTQSKYIMKAPRVPGLRSYSCSSENNSGLNYQIKIHTGSDKIECSCKNYKIYSICFHALATAEVDITLFPYILWHRKHVKTRLPVGVFTQSVNAVRAGRKENLTIRKRTKPNADAIITCPKQTNITPCTRCLVDHNSVVPLVDLQAHQQHASAAEK